MATTVHKRLILNAKQAQSVSLCMSAMSLVGGDVRCDIQEIGYLLRVFPYDGGIRVVKIVVYSIEAQEDYRTHAEFRNAYGIK